MNPVAPRLDAELVELVLPLHSAQLRLSPRAFADLRSLVAALQVSAEMAGDPQRLSHVQQAHLSPAAWWGPAGGRRASSAPPGGVNLRTASGAPGRTCTDSTLTRLQRNKLSARKTLSSWERCGGERFFLFDLFEWTEESRSKQQLQGFNTGQRRAA